MGVGFRLNEADLDLVVVECLNETCGHQFQMPRDAAIMLQDPGDSNYCGKCEKSAGIKIVCDPTRLKANLRNTTGKLKTSNCH